MPSASEPVARRRRRATRVGLVVLCALIGWGVVADRWILRPPVDAPSEADAVVVFLGPAALDRATVGQALVDAGWAPELAVSQPGADALGSDWHRRCQNREEKTPLVICFDPDPDTTRGEARATASLMREHGWNRVMVVVSRDQVTRARLLLGRCGVHDPIMIGIESSWGRSKQVLYQSGALVKAWLLRGC